MRLLMVATALPLVLMTVLPAEAQELEVTPFAGFGFGGTFEQEDGELSIDEAARFGLAVDVPILERVQLEIRYMRHGTRLVERSSDLFGPSAGISDLTVHHALGGLLWEIRGGRLRPFVVATVGAAGFAPRRDDLVAEWRFAAGLGGGLKVFLSDGVGLRLEALALPAIVDPGRERLFCASPAGECFLRITEVSALYQGALSGGLILAF